MSCRVLPADVHLTVASVENASDAKKDATYNAEDDSGGGGGGNGDAGGVVAAMQMASSNNGGSGGGSRLGSWSSAQPEPPTPESLRVPGSGGSDPWLFGEEPGAGNGGGAIDSGYGTRLEAIAMGAIEDDDDDDDDDLLKVPSAQQLWGAGAADGGTWGTSTIPPAATSPPHSHHSISPGSSNGRMQEQEQEQQQRQHHNHPHHTNSGGQYGDHGANSNQFNLDVKGDTDGLLSFVADPRVAAWLTGLGLEKYVGLFTTAEVDMDALSLMSDGDLRELGISMLGPRKKMLSALRG